MSIFQSPYDTTFGQSAVIAPIVHSLEKYLIRANSSNDQISLESNLPYKGLEINGLVAEQSDIPVFYHPLCFTNQKNQKYVAIDTRSFIRSDTSSNVNVVNKPEYQFVIDRYLLQFAWVNYGPEYFRSNFFFGSVVFSAWISELIAKRYALDPADVLKIKILTFYYYATLFNTEDKLPQSQIDRLIIHTMKFTRATDSYIKELFDLVGPIRNISDFCNTIKETVNNIRLKEFSPGILITLVTNSWFGYQSKEVIAIALEHPPTWTAVLIAALNERTFKNSTIAKIAEKVAKLNQAEEFNKNYKIMLEGIVISKSKELTLEDLENVKF